MAIPFINANLFSAHTNGGFVNPIQGLIDANGGGAILNQTNSTLGALPDVGLGSLEANNAITAALTGTNGLQDFTKIYGSTVGAAINDMDHTVSVLSVYGTAASQLPGILSSCTDQASSIFAPFQAAGKAALEAIQAALKAIEDAALLGAAFLLGAYQALLAGLAAAQKVAQKLLDDAKAALASVLKSIADYAFSSKLGGFLKDKCLQDVLHAVLSPATLTAASQATGGANTPV